MSKRLSSSIALAALVLLVLPVASDGTQATCCTATTSLASMAVGPTIGDEAFFKLPSGPANVMLLVDTSGSMAQFPQCADWAWDDSSGLPTCKSPTLADPNPSGSPTLKVGDTWTSTATTSNAVVTGTCTPFTDKTGPSLKWMEDVVPQTGYADPGRTNALLWDCPPWGDGGTACGTNKCSGDGCLFDPGAYYLYRHRSSGGDYLSWSTSSSGASAVRWELDGVTSGTTKPNIPPCTAIDTTTNPPTVLTDCNGNPVNLGSACTTCMTNHGFFFYRVAYANGCSGTSPRKISSTVTKGPFALFKGTFLNGNPPKFVSARAVVKTLAWMDPNDKGDQASLDQVRLGLSIVADTKTDPQQARLIVPFGPDKASAFPPTQANFRQARQMLLSVLNYDKTVYKDGTTTILDGTKISGGFFNPATGGTPLGSALFNVGQYFSSAPTATTTGFYDQAFTDTGCKSGWSSVSCQVDDFKETSAGDVSAPWVTQSGAAKCSICWGCSNNSVVVVTDGSPNNEIAFPDKIVNQNSPGYKLASNCGRATCATCPSAPASTDTSSCTTCPCTPCGTAACTVVNSCYCTEPVDNKAAVMPRVADWLHNTDLRSDTVMSGKQNLTVHTIGFNVPSSMDPRAANILRATAQLGGGNFYIAQNAAELSSAVIDAVKSVIPKENSFSAATANPLQTVQTTAAQAFLTRFKPSENATWEGHVFEAFLFDESLNGCINGLTPDKQPQVSCGQGTKAHDVSADFNEDGVCGQTFMIDLDCDEVAENPTTGDFVKKGSTTPANLPWDAGAVLSYSTKTGYKSADESADNHRTIFTWVDGKRVDLTGALTNVDKLLPYLNIDSAWCSTFLTNHSITVPTGTTQLEECAKQVIYFVRGWDVLDLDKDSCGGPDNSKNTTSCQRKLLGEERDRDQDNNSTPFFWKLGDISHSSPAVLQAPIDEFRCGSGFEKQCQATIFSPPVLPNQTKFVGTNDEYLAYRTANIARQRVLLVGANDGMLHAFDAGNALTSSKPDLTGSYPYDNGSGSELWAFVPPDLLPRLRNLLDGHQYMVDGSVMVRDVWVDGSSASDGLSTPTAPSPAYANLSSADQKKAKAEFHTVAVFGRRAGGNAYSALDVTDPSKPTFLWNFPQGCSDDARFLAQSWNDFAPRSPPIGPVKLGSTTDARGYEERWIVLLGGGYDPTLNKGRGVFMLDVWTGATLWRYTDDDFKANMGFTATGPSMFPVPGGAVMADIGDPFRQQYDQDGFFDTAVWGDLGGNLFVARFQEVGTIDATLGRVPSRATAKGGGWFAARAFEQQRQSDDSQKVAGRNEFFYMPTMAFEPVNHVLHAYLGSGNRERIMNQVPICGPDNLMGCCQAGCTSVSSSIVDNYGAYSRTDSFSCSGGTYTHSTSDSSAATTPYTCAASPGNSFVSTVKLNYTCPGFSAVSKTGTATCDGSGLCTVSPVWNGDDPTNQLTGSNFTALGHHRFYGVWAYGGDQANKTFKDATSAKVFDQHRFTDSAYSGTCTTFGSKGCSLVNVTQAKVTYDTTNPQFITTACADSSSKCTATVDDPGWFYEYGDRCPLASCTSSSWTDEKTGSGANVLLGCVAWSGFRPVGVTTSTDPCSGDLGTPVAYGYSANYISGAPSAVCGYAKGGTDYIASQRTLTAPPSTSQARVDVLTKPKGGGGSSSSSGGGGGTVGDGCSTTGGVVYEMLNLDAGSPPSSKALGTQCLGGAPVYWLEVPRKQHACRHTVAGQSSCE